MKEDSVIKIKIDKLKYMKSAKVPTQRAFSALQGFVETEQTSFRFPNWKSSQYVSKPYFRLFLSIHSSYVSSVSSIHLNSLFVLDIPALLLR